MIAIPQPEVHLHPKAQCAFGTLVFRNWQDNNNQYLLETHSEYMINRFRYEMLNSEKAPKGKAQVLFSKETRTAMLLRQCRLVKMANSIVKFQIVMETFLLTKN